MSIIDNMTKLEKKFYREEKVKQIRDYNQDLIKDLDIKESEFNAKRLLSKNGVMVVSIFANEFKTTKGYYFELIDSDYEPYPDRTVYRLSPSEFFDEEYQTDEYGKYLVPIDNLRIVNRQSVAISKSSAVMSSDKVLSENTSFMKPKFSNNSTFNKQEDAPYSEMTIRDYYAIHIGKPVSLKSWLNELIKNNK